MLCISMQTEKEKYEYEKCTNEFQNSCYRHC